MRNESKREIMRIRESGQTNNENEDSDQEENPNEIKLSNE
jgi:hypothetical protein